MIRKETKTWFRTAGMQIRFGLRDFGFGIEMFLQDIAEWITYHAERGFVRVEHGVRWIAECLYHARTNLRRSWNWAMHRKGDPFLLDDDPKRKWRKAWFYLRSACFHIGRLSRLVWQEERHRWNGPHSLRIKIGGLYFGGAWRENCRAIWVIYNGKLFCWQIQTWRPRLAIWKTK